MDSSEKPNHLSTFIAVLIATVTVVGAIIAWRAAVALSDASGADTHGILAAVEREDVNTRATITLLGHLSAYSAFVRDDALAKAYDGFASANPQRADLTNYASAFRLAANYAQDLIPPAYLDRDEKLDRQRDLGENIAQASINKDVQPEQHFSVAETSEQKAQWLLADLILLGVVLVLLTLADAIQNLLRYLFLLGGAGLFGISVIIVVVIEFFGPPMINILNRL